MRHSQGKAFFILCIVTILSSLANGQCPAFGADTTCGTVITITDAGAFVSFTGQGPYDGSDDTLLGVVNNSSKLSITSLELTSPFNIFGFDFDGIDAYGAPGNGFDSTGYGGPNSYFTNISPDTTTGTVNFIVPLAPNGGTTYFSLENSLAQATACADVINGSVPDPPQLGGAGLLNGYTTIITTFTPMYNYTVSQAAQLCGFTAFDWVQTITHIPDPNPFCAFNSDPSVPNPSPFSCELPKLVSPFPIHLTSHSVNYNDPPPNGYTYGFYNSFPFYYPSNRVIADIQNLPAPPTLCAEKQNGVCILYVVDPSGNALHAFDAPADACISENVLGLPVPSPAYLLSADVRAACGQSITGINEYIGFTTHLAGIKADGTPFDLGIGYTWTSNFNGTFGGISTTASTGPVDPGSGTGGITVINVNETTSYQYPKSFGVIGINGNPVSPPPSGSMLLTGTQISTTASGLAYSRLTKTFNGTVTIKNISSSPIAGPFQIVLNSLTSGVTLANATSSFGGWSYITVPGVGSLAPGQPASVSVQFSNPQNKQINFSPVTYSGSFN